jgi:hypothetical protein
MRVAHEGLENRISCQERQWYRRKWMKFGRAWWYTSLIPALGKLRQEDVEFKASLYYIVRACRKGREERRGRGGEQRRKKRKKKMGEIMEAG